MSGGVEARRAGPHAPRRGRAVRILGRFHVTGVFWYRLHVFGVTKLPERLTAPLVALFTAFFFLVLRQARRALASNLAVVLGPCGWWTRQRRIWRTLHAFAWCLTERYERLCTPARFRVDLEGEEVWQAVTARRRGFVMTTAHVGLWEAGSMMPATLEGRAVHVVREAEADDEAQRFIEGLLRRRFGGSVPYTTHFAAADAHLGVELLEALREGEIVALQADRPRAGGRTVPASLFGAPVDLPAGPAALARAAGADIVPAYTFRTGRRAYRVVLEPPITVPSTGDRSADLRAAAAQLASSIERAIARDPFQWFCFAEVWPGRRSGLPARH